MRIRLVTVVFLLVIITQGVSAQDPLDVVREFYARTLTASQNAKTRADIVSLVEAADTPDWVSVGPAGDIVQTRPQTIQSLEQMLAVEPGRRPLPGIEVLWVDQQPQRILAVCLVLPPGNPPAVRSKSSFGSDRQASLTLVGTLVRDTFVQTNAGWRRTKHEKLLPDQWSVPSRASVVIAPR